MKCPELAHAMADTLQNPTIADLRAALKPATEVKTTEEPKTTEPAVTEETQTATETTETTPEVKTEPEVKTTEETKGDKKPKRFSELTRLADEARAETARVRAELEALKAGKTAEPIKAEPVAATETEPEPPNAETFTGTWAELEAARIKWAADLADFKVRQVLKTRDEAASRATQEAAAQEAGQRWTAQIDAAAEKHGHDAMKAAIDAVGPIATKILGLVDVIRESEVGAEILVALHNDAEKLAAIAKLSPFSAAREIGRIEDRILSKRPVSGTAATGKTLPTPPSVVGGNPGGSTKEPELEKMGLKDFKASVRRQLNLR